MTWLTLRQFRVQAISVVGCLLAMAALLAMTGPGVDRLLDDTGEGFEAAFLGDRVYRMTSYVALAVVHLVPAVVGVFWGAPLVARELEAGTPRLVWTQGVSRNRWLATKLLILGAAVAVVGLFGLVSSWWFAPIDSTVNTLGTGDDLAFGAPRLSGLVFGSRGIVPVGFALVAFALGVSIGLLVRRTVPAMATTLAVVVGLQVAVPLLLQPRLIDPVETVTPITADNLSGLMFGGPPGEEQDPEIVELQVSIDSPGAWILTNETVDPDGHPVEIIPASVAARCTAGGGPQMGPPPECFAAIADAGYQQRVRYHPADRYWPMQWRETGVLVTLAFALGGFCFWRIRRDLA